MITHHHDHSRNNLLVSTNLQTNEKITRSFSYPCTLFVIDNDAHFERNSRHLGDADLNVSGIFALEGGLTLVSATVLL